MIEIDVDFGDLDKEVDAAIESEIQKILKRFSVIGEMYITESRSNKTYKDQTGNLKNANGYAVYRDGLPVFSDFGRFESNLRTFFDSLITGEGIEFVCGNPLEYASYVEGKGFVVVSGGFLKVIDEVNKLLAE